VFVRTFWGEKPATEKVEALKKACIKHSAITKDCAKAQGHDRHLYALYCIWQRSLDEGYETGTDVGSIRSASPIPDGDPNSIVSSPSRKSVISDDGSLSTSPQGHQVQHSMPPLFADAGWDKINQTILSTSNCGNPSLRQFGFGPTSGDGFGIGYIIKDGSVSICASSKHRQTSRFIDALEAYFLEIRKLLRQTKRRGTSADKTTSRAREAEENARHRPKTGRMKSHGRNIMADPSSKLAGVLTPQTEQTEQSDDEGLGGCTTSLLSSYSSRCSHPCIFHSPCPFHDPLEEQEETVGNLTGSSEGGRTSFRYGIPTPGSSPPKQQMRGLIMNTPPQTPVSTRSSLRLPPAARRRPTFSLL
jgi:carnitine O-acetyltransferase